MEQRSKQKPIEASVFRIREQSLSLEQISRRDDEPDRLPFTAVGPIQPKLIHISNDAEHGQDWLIAEHPTASSGQIAEALLDRRAIVVLTTLRSVESAVTDVLELAKHLRDVSLPVERKISKRGISATNAASCGPSWNGELRVYRECVAGPLLPALNVAPSLPEKFLHQGGFSTAFTKVWARGPASKAVKESCFVGASKESLILMIERRSKE